MKKSTKDIRYLTKNGSRYFVQIVVPGVGRFRQSLLTDSFQKAAKIMEKLTPYLALFKACEIDSLALNEAFKNILTNASLTEVAPVIIASQNTPVVKPRVIKRPANYLSLSDAWKQYFQWKSECLVQSYNDAVAIANDKGRKTPINRTRQELQKTALHSRILFACLGEDTNVHEITGDDVQGVLNLIPKLPNRRQPPYNKMSDLEIVQWARNNTDVDAINVGQSTVEKHWKTFCQFFKRYLHLNTDILKSDISTKWRFDLSPKKEKSFSTYSAYEMRQIVSHCLNLKQEKDEWFKWSVLLIAHSGARMGEIARLTMEEIKTDPETGRPYLYILDGKTENAVRRIVIHPLLVENGFMDFVEKMRKKGNRLFPVLTETNMTKLDKNFNPLLVKLGISKRNVEEGNGAHVLHSFRHTVNTKIHETGHEYTMICAVLGHAFDKKDTNRRTYLTTKNFSISAIAPVLDSLDWVS